jgi:hypothetical protein
MRDKRLVVFSLLFPAFVVACMATADDQKTAPAPSAAFGLSSIALPGAPADGVLLDYLAVDRPHHRVWVPAGGTGRVDVIDTKTQELHPIEKF